MTETFPVKRLRPTAILPKRAHPEDAGLDLCADLEGAKAAGMGWRDLGAEIQEGPDGLHYLLALPGSRVRIPTGLAMATPEATFGDLRDKSGLAWSHGVTILGGVCDRRYRGEYMVVALNTGGEPWVVTHGMRMAQMVLTKISFAQPVEADLDATERGAGGFGSTGA